MSEPATILIVEDEAKIASLLRDYLEKVGGYQTHWVDRGDEAVQAFEEVSPQLVLLDLMLPGMDGLEVCVGQANPNQDREIGILVKEPLQFMERGHHLVYRRRYEPGRGRTRSSNPVL